jgi:hypothetical protein
VRMTRDLNNSGPFDARTLHENAAVVLTEIVLGTLWALERKEDSAVGRRFLRTRKTAMR